MEQIEVEKYPLMGSNMQYDMVSSFIYNIMITLTIVINTTQLFIFLNSIRQLRLILAKQTGKLGGMVNRAL